MVRHEPVSPPRLGWVRVLCDSRSTPQKARLASGFTEMARTVLARSTPLLGAASQVFYLFAKHAPSIDPRGDKLPSRIPCVSPYRQDLQLHQLQRGCRFLRRVSRKDGVDL